MGEGAGLRGAVQSEVMKEQAVALKIPVCCLCDSRADAGENIPVFSHSFTQRQQFHCMPQHAWDSSLLYTIKRESDNDVGVTRRRDSLLYEAILQLSSGFISSGFTSNFRRRLLSASPRLQHFHLHRGAS